MNSEVKKMSEKGDKRFEVLKNSEIDEIKEELKKKFEGYDYESRSIRAYGEDLRHVNIKIIDFLIEQLAIARTKIWLKNHRE